MTDADAPTRLIEEGGIASGGVKYSVGVGVTFGGVSMFEDAAGFSEGVGVSSAIFERAHKSFKIEF